MEMEEKIEQIKLAIKNGGQYSRSDYSLVHQKHIEELMTDWAKECMELLDSKIKSDDLDIDELIEILQIFNNLDAFEKLPEFLQGKIHKFIAAEKCGYICDNYHQQCRKIAEFIVEKVKNSNLDKKYYQVFIDLLKLVLGRSYNIANVLEKVLKIKDFAIGKIPALTVAKLVLENSFEVEGYESLIQLAKEIIADKTKKKLKVHADLLRYFDDIRVIKDKIGTAVILKLQKKVLTSSDLNMNLDADTNEVHIVCDILHVDDDLPVIFRGLNLFIFSKVIKLHKSNLWDISGLDSTHVFTSNAGKDNRGNGKEGTDGNPGKSGGNCKIICQKILNPELWTIQSNGGNGSNGQDGGDREDVNEIDETDFQLLDKEVTNQNFLEVLNKLNCKTELGSWRKTFYENGKEVCLLFNRMDDICELPISIKGTSGRLGGLGGLGGQGGFAGKIQINDNIKGINFSTINANDGINGTCGYNGYDSRDDSYMFKFYENKPISLQKFKNSTLMFDGLTDYQPITSETCYKDYIDTEYVTPEKIRIDIDLKIAKLMDYETKFYKTILSVVRNSNCQFSKLVKDLRLQEFVNGHDNTKTFLTNILNHTFNVKDYEILADLASVFVDRSLNIEKEVRSALKDYLNKCQYIQSSADHIEVRNMIVTSNDIDLVFNIPKICTTEIDKITVTCDVLHINSDLSEKFRGISLQINANSVHIHQHVTWNLSGFEIIEDPAIFDEHAKSQLSNRNGENGTDGGDCVISCKSMTNPSLLTIISNGGNGTDGVIMWNGIGKNGIDITVNHLDLPEKLPIHSKFYEYENDNIKKYLAYQSVDNYILLAEGTAAQRAPIDAAGLGGQGGLPGLIKIHSACVSDEIQVKKFTCYGQNGKNADFTYESFCDGRDAYLVVKNGKKNFYGLKEFNKFEFCKSASKRKGSVRIDSFFYYIKQTHTVKSYTTVLDDFRFYDSLVIALKNPMHQPRIMTELLNLDKFAYHDASLRDIVQNVQKWEFSGKCYSALKELARYYHFENPKYHAKLRSEMKQLIAKLDIFSLNKIVTAKKKILKLSEVLQSDFNKNFEEFYIVADVLFINCSLPSIFRGKNLAIIANSVEILDSYTFDLSGLDLDPEKDEFNGKPGGNFALICKSIKNSSALTVISNGSDGKNGQDGKDGADGENGQDATEKSFFIEESEWKISFFSKNSIPYESGHFEVKTDDGLTAHVYQQPGFMGYSGLMLVKGSNGQAGELGEPGEYGGKGGYAGSVFIECKGPANVKISLNAGRDGKDGIGGMNGTNGKAGRDLWKYDEHFWTATPLHGMEGKKKFKFVWSDDNIDNSVFDNDTKKYVHVEEDLETPITSQSRERNPQKINRKVATQLNAKPKNLMRISTIKDNYAGFLEENETTSTKDDREVIIPPKKRPTEHKFAGISSSKKFATKDFVDLSKSLEIYKISTAKQSKATRMHEINSEQFIEEYSRFTSKNLNELDQILKHTPKIQSLQLAKSTTAPIRYKAKVPKIRKLIQRSVTTIYSPNLNSLTSAEEFVNMTKICSFFKEVTESLIAKNLQHDFKIERNQQIFTLDNKLPFMKPCSNFVTGIENFDKHFQLGPFYNEILDHFNSQINDPTSNLAELIMNLMIKFARDFDEITDILISYREQVVKIMDECKSCTTNVDPEYRNWFNIEVKFLKILRSFFNNEKIMYIIYKDITEKGIESLIYKEILAYKFGLKLIICIQNINNDIQVVSIHNNPDELVYEGHENDQTIFVLETNETYKLLYLQLQKYEHYKMRTLQEFRYDMLALNLMTFEENSYEGYNYCKELIDSIKKSLLDHQVSSIIKSYLQPQFSDDELIDMILEKVEETAGRLTESDKVSSEEFFKVTTKDKVSRRLESLGSSTNLSESQSELSITKSVASLRSSSSVTSCGLSNSKSTVDVSKEFSIVFIDGSNKKSSANFSNKISEEPSETSFHWLANSTFDPNAIQLSTALQNLKDYLTTIANNIEGSPILMALATRLSSDSTHLNIEYFSTIIRSIASILNENTSGNMITFMIYGNEQQDWILELLMLKIENVLDGIEVNVREKWTNVLKNMKVSPFIYLLLEKLIDPDMKVPTVKDMDKIIQNLENFKLQDYENVKDCNLSSWKSMTTENHWDKNLIAIFKDIKLDANSKQNLKIIFEDLKNQFGAKIETLVKILNLKSRELPKLNLNEFFNFLKSGQWTLSDEILRTLESHSVGVWIKIMKEHFNSNNLISDGPKIAKYIKMDDEASPNIKEAIDSIVEDVKQVFEQSSQLNNKKIMKFSENEISEWINGHKKSYNILESLAIITRVVQLKTKDKLTLRDTQLTAILTMWKNSNHGILLKLSSGEGKTITAIAFAILKILNGEKLDIITSSRALAERDATDAENLRIFDFFNIKVGHNCHEDFTKRKEVYQNCQVVYGTLNNFQRDYLLTEFYDQSFMFGHHFQNVLVDEIDSLLLDKDNNIFYLSLDHPDFEEIDAVFVLIWNCVNQQFGEWIDKNLIRNYLLNSFFGILKTENVQSMNPDTDAEKIIKILKHNQILDDNNLITEKIYNEEEFPAVLDVVDPSIADKIKLVCRKKIEAEKAFKIPKHLKDFVIQHLNEWIESAIQAKLMQNETDYIVDRQIIGAISSSDPKIIILNKDTGTNMNSLQWDCGLHQFLQLKHGCDLSPLKLKSVFSSNVSFLSKYGKLYGMAGEVGNFEELNKVIRVHHLDFVAVPRHLSRKFTEYSAILTRDENGWLHAIRNETLNILNNKRTVLLICNTVQEIKIIQRYLESSVKKLIILKRETDNFNMEKVDHGLVIISTNLAARGIDLKLSKSLKNNGGIHIILTYLPLSARIENHAFGSAARGGDKGSGRLIIQAEYDESILRMKIARNNKEIHELDGIGHYFENFVKIEKEVFGEFQAEYEMLKNDEPEHLEIYQQNLKLQWTLWLDENLKNLDIHNSYSTIQANFEQFKLSKNHLLPVSTIKLFKKLEEENFIEATHILDGNFHEDLLSLQYLKCYQMLKNNQIENNYKPRSLKHDEICQLIKTTKMLDVVVFNRMLSIRIINNLKNDNNIVPIQAYEEQQTGMIEIYKMLKDSLKMFSGTDVNFGMISNDVFKADLIEVLKNNGFMLPLRVSPYLIIEDVRQVANNFNINFEDLYAFLSKRKAGFISQMVTENFKKTIQLPSHEDFLDMLLQKGIFKKQIEYAIINLVTAEAVDPAFHELVTQKFKNEELASKAFTTEFFAPLNPESKKDQEFVIRLNLLKPLISSDRQQRLMETGVMRILRHAHFDNNKYEELKNSKIFDNFDEICDEDFKTLCSNYEGIINMLTGPNVMLLIPRTSTTYSLNCSMLKILSFSPNLGDFSVYQEAIIKLITSKFAYRLALDSFVNNLEFNGSKFSVQLPSDPYRQLLNELINKNIIEQPKVNSKNLNKCEHFLKSLNIDDLYTIAGLVGEPFNMETKILIQKHLDWVIKNAEKIKKNLKFSVPTLMNEELKDTEVVLEAIDKTISEGQSKAPIWIIKTQEKQ